MSNQNDKEDVVRHPWGVSRSWVVKGYSPARWLSGASRRRQWPAGAGSDRPFVLPIPGATVTSGQASVNQNQLINAAAGSSELNEEEPIDKLRILHVGAFVVLAISSIGSLLLSYKMYNDKRRQGAGVLESISNIEEPDPLFGPMPENKTRIIKGHLVEYTPNSIYVYYGKKRSNNCWYWDVESGEDCSGRCTEEMRKILWNEVEKQTDYVK
jgi:hypothetical protein